MKGGGLMIALGPSKDGKGEDVEAEETDEPSDMEDAARTLVEALGLKPERLDMSAIAMALENFVACCGREEDEG